MATGKLVVEVDTSKLSREVVRPLRAVGALRKLGMVTLRVCDVETDTAEHDERLLPTVCLTFWNSKTGRHLGKVGHAKALRLLQELLSVVS